MLNDNYEFRIDKYKITVNFNYFENNSSTSSFIKIYNENNDFCSCFTSIVMGSEINNEFFALNVNYKEPYYCSKKFSPKRDRMNDREILISRSVDKMLRPTIGMFTQKDISINIINLKIVDWFDMKSMASIAAIITTRSLFAIPVGFCRLGVLNKEIVLFPSHKIINNLETDLLISGNKKQIFSIEMDSAPTKNLKYFKHALNICEEFYQQLMMIHSEVAHPANINKEYGDLLTTQKPKNLLELDTIFAENSIQDSKNNNMESFIDFRTQVSKFIVDNGRFERPDDNIRKIKILDSFQDNNSSAIFQRGNTVVLSSISLGQEKVTNYELLKEEFNIICFYNFAGFASGNLQSKYYSSREVGHSDLIRKAFQNVIDKNLVIRMDCETLSADGSSSMASVCAVSTSLKKRGVLSENVAGISVGLFRSGSDFRLVTDISGLEDKYSEVDFKIAGNKEGITAIHMDAKSYLEVSLLRKIIDVGLAALDNILAEMDTFAINSNMKLHHVSVEKNKIGLLIGSGGGTVNDISDFTDTKIKINQSGSVILNGKNIDLCMEFIRAYGFNNFFKKDNIAFFTKEQSNDKFVQSPIGELSLNKKQKIPTGSVVFCTIVDPEKKKVKITRILNKSNHKVLFDEKNNTEDLSDNKKNTKEKPQTIKKIEKPKTVKKVEKPKTVKKVEKPKTVKKVEKPKTVKKVEKPKTVKKVEKSQTIKKIEKPQTVKKAEIKQKLKVIKK